MSETDSDIPTIKNSPRSKYGLFIPISILALGFLVYLFLPSNDAPPASALDELDVQPIKDAEKTDDGSTGDSGQLIVRPLVIPVLPLNDTTQPLIEETSMSDYFGGIPVDPLNVTREVDEGAYLARLKAPKVISVSGSQQSAQASASSEIDDLNLQVIETLRDQLGDPITGGNAQSLVPAVAPGYFVDNIQRPALEATFLEQLDFTLLESTIIPVVIDQAIDTDLPGRLRATVSRNVWSADGARILIPRGTRAMGEYTAAIVEGQSRVFAIWTRLLDPWGLDVPIASGASDRLGMAGLDGKVNRHFFKRFGSAALISIIGGYAQAETDNSNQREAIANDFNTATSTALQSSIDIAPTITRTAASIASIYVNQDINFFKAYEVGLAKKREREQARYTYVSIETTRTLNEIAAGRPQKNISALDVISTFADPNPLRLGKLPLSVGAARRSSDNQLANGFKTAFSITKALETVRIDSTTRPNSCEGSFTVTKNRLLSVLVQDFLLECGFILDQWLPEKNGIVMDWKFLESAQISMPDSISSLAALLSQYSIKLILDESVENRYVVTQFKTTTYQLQKN